MPLQRQALLNCLHLQRDTHQDTSSDEHGNDYEALPADAVESEPNGLDLLLVEDNVVNQMVASGILKKLGYTVAIAENGERALNALNLRHYDLVLMDCQMPIMNGYEATREIRKHSQWSDLPIIAVTANVMQGDKDDCIKAGMNDYITKPYKKEDLIVIVERWAPPSHQDS